MSFIVWKWSATWKLVISIVASLIKINVISSFEQNTIKKEKKKNNGLMVFLLINRFYPEFFLCLNLSMFITNEFSTVKCCIQIWKHLPWEWREHYTYRVSQTYPFKGLYSWTNKKSQIMHMHLKTIKINN